MAMTGVTVYDNSGNLTSISKVLKENYEKPFLSALDQDTTAFQLFSRKAIDDAWLRWKIHYQGNTAVEWYDEDDAYGTAGKQAYENANVTVKMVRVNVEYSGLAAASTKGQGSYINVRADELEKALDDLRDNINDKVFVHAAPAVKEMDNLYTIIDSTGTYAGIDRGVLTWFGSKKLANGGTPRPISVGLLQTMHNSLTIEPRRKAKISSIITSQTHLDQYGDLAESRRRFDGNNINVDLGVNALSYKGIPLMAIPGFVDGRMYFLDKRSWNIIMLLPFSTDEVPSSKDSEVFAIKSYLNLVCKAPYQQGVIVDLEP